MPDQDQLKAQYLRIYKAADEILKGPDNPCQIQVVDGTATCVLSRRDQASESDQTRRFGHRHGSLCCSGCKHHDPKVGCTVQSLGCKVAWCCVSNDHIDGMATKDHPMFISLQKLRREATKLRVPMNFRSSFEENFAPRLWEVKI